MKFSTQQREELYVLMGKKIKKKREERKFSQKKLADYSGIARTTLINIEGGKQSVSLHTFISISKYLGCNFEELLPDLNEIKSIGRSEIRSKRVPQITADEIRSILDDI